MKNDRYPHKLAVIDFETTGFKAGEDEILQVAIVNELGQQKLNVYCKPEHKTEWQQAQAVNHISPEMVANAKPFREIAGTVRRILDNAEYVIAYNADFENGFLQAAGIGVNKEKWIDPMLIFAEIYGEEDPVHGGYKWKSLSVCADYYGFEFKAHDALEDVRATLYCYLEMEKRANGNAGK